MMMKLIEESSPEQTTIIHAEWDKNIRDRFELNINELQKTETITEQEKKVLYSFMENLIKEINKE